MTRFRNVKLGVFRQNQNIKTISKKKIMGQNRLKQLSKFQKFQLSNFTLTWSNHSNKKQKDSLETLAVLIEISMLCWNLPSSPKHRGSLQNNIAFPEGDNLFLGDFRANLDETNTDMVQFTKIWNWKWIA